MGLAPTGVCRVPPHPPLSLEDPLLPSSPSTPLGLFARLREGAAQAVGGEGSQGARGWRGGGVPSIAA